MVVIMLKAFFKFIYLPYCDAVARAKKRIAYARMCAVVERRGG